ncbi:MAG: prohibitin family protein [Bacteroidetes bacterium]|nr:prohibitin family protein [Bacteroidota bacterium]MBU1680858.1 prohibitin family protein [Bacteroidota bacterium]MBU2506911.1 prohibitin family protein [Bacteroidota bacterium]
MKRKEVLNNNEISLIGVKTMKTQHVIIIGLLAGVILAGCGTTIPGGYEGLHWGRYSRVDTTVYGNEFKWEWAWNSVILYDVRWQTQSEKVDILSNDDLHMEVVVSLRLRPKPNELYFLHTEIGEQYYTEVVQQEFRSASRAVFSQYRYIDIPKKSLEIQNAILTELTENLKGKHLDLDAVQIKHVDYPERVKQAADIKLATEQKLLQKEFELKIAEKDATIKIIDAKGQQTAQKIIDSTLTASYLQYRALDIQKELAKSGNASFYFVPVGVNGIPIILETGIENKK